MKLDNILNFIGIITAIVVQSASSGAARCNTTCGHHKLTFPFGFSGDCQIQLNCTSDATILVAGFPVQSVNGDAILVNLPAECGRPVEMLGRLFTANFAPTSHNSILLQNCRSHAGSGTGCIIPTTMVETQFELLDCGKSAEINDSISCYSEPHNTTSFLNYENLTRRHCRNLFSAISIDSFANNSSVSLDVQMVRLSWWLPGACRCSKNAKCVYVAQPVDRNATAYRCECLAGFAGDGFLDGFGCRKGAIYPSETSGNNSSNLPTVLGSTIGSIGALCLIMLCIILHCKKRHLSGNAKNPNLENFLPQLGSLIPKSYKYSEIKKITRSFTEKLGQGGFGRVYKGTLSNGCVVAVKVLTVVDSNGEEFINEVASISRTSHVNIVNLLGFCNEKNKRALVYEFLSNKSLDKFIGKVENPNFLDVEKLYKIAIGVAKGLEYLHTGCNTRIVHFDIKPQNILLDEEFNPKISDFGLAKLCRTKKSILSLIGVRGTFGYMAPEVFSRYFGPISLKSDVYSYGMMVLEMAGAKDMVEAETTQSSENYFPDKIYEKLMLDLNVTREQVNNESIIEEDERVNKMLLVGFWCIQTAPSDRPSMSRVAEMLEGNLESIQIPPKPILCHPNISRQELSTYMETEESNDDSPESMV